jgi:hypothetical protein
MIKLVKRSMPPHPITKEADYRSNPNFNALVEDCLNKCYICEINPTTLNVEHLIPHKGDNSLKYDWHNLFLSCGHCNNIKLDNYDSILDPSKCDPEDYLALSLIIDSDPFVERVLIEVLSDEKETLTTAELLECVYNGSKTPIKEVESANLRNVLSECIVRFLKYIENYRAEPDIGYDSIIKKEISRSSAFAAFKRKIVRDDPELSAKFAAALM